MKWIKFYVFKGDSLSYEKFNFFTLKRILIFLGIQLLLSLVLVLFISSFYSTPKEKKLKKDVKYLISEFNTVNQQIIKIESILDHVKENDSIIYESIFESTESRKKGFETLYEDEINNDYDAFVESIHTKISILDKNLSKELYLLNDLVGEATRHQDMLTRIPAIQPIDNKDLKRTASGWGWRIHPIYKIRKFHYGLDFTAPVGTPIYSTGDGIIEFIASSTDKASQGYGNIIIINHGYSYKTLYGHMSKFNVKKGQTVKRGQIIGFVGSTGLSTGPHLHYEVIKDNEKVNPINYLFNSLTPEEYQTIIEISNNIKKSYD